MCAHDGHTAMAQALANIPFMLLMGDDFYRREVYLVLGMTRHPSYAN